MTSKSITYILLTVCFLLGKHAQAQTCLDNITKTSPTHAFTLNGDGTATDSKTGLTWMRCGIGQSWNGSSCAGTLELYNWKDALVVAEEHVFAGKDDWRLPNIKELASIVESSCHIPAINSTIFPATRADRYWSSTPASSRMHHTDGLNGFLITFYHGIVFNHGLNSKESIRLVRN